jgi:hypothetical protein
MLCKGVVKCPSEVSLTGLGNADHAHGPSLNHCKFERLKREAICSILLHIPALEETAAACTALRL